MRLLYDHVIKSIPQRNCRMVIDVLKGRVAIPLDVYLANSEKNQNDFLRSEYVRKFLTTSRPVENWLQTKEKEIHKMALEKVPTELWWVNGGYGAGKSHMKEYLLSNANKNPKLFLVDLDLTPLTSSNLSTDMAIDNIFSLMLLQKTEQLDFLYDSIKKDEDYSIESSKKVKEGIKESSYSNEFREFVDVLFYYGEQRDRNHRDFQPLQDFIARNSHYIFLPLMKLYKKYLKIEGVGIFVDEFERMNLVSPEIRDRFLDSIKMFYDKLASARPDLDLPSFKLIILCSLSYWEQIKNDTRSQALETRAEYFEVPQLNEDEIIALAEKIYTIYKKAGFARSDKSELMFDFTLMPSYLAKIAGIAEPLTPRFVIKELINIIEKPADYLGYMYQPSPS